MSDGTEAQSPACAEATRTSAVEAVASTSAVEEGRKILAESDVDIINAVGLTDAAQKVVAAAGGTAA